MSGDSHLQRSVWGIEIRTREWGAKKWTRYLLRDKFHLTERRALQERDLLCCNACAPGHESVDARVVPFRRDKGRIGRRGAK